MNRLMSGLAMLVLTVPSLASATGLVGGWADGQSQLRAPYQIGLQLQLTESTATVTETRQWPVANFAPRADVPDGVVEAPELRFYRSLLSPGAGIGDATVVAATVNGSPLDGTLLFGAEADAMRRTLTSALGDPAPLRELGSPLWVSDPLPAEHGQYGDVEVVFSFQQALAPRGTMAGIAIPLDWSRGTVSLNVEATIATDSPLRAVYSPYHQLALERDGDFKGTATFSGYGQPTEFPVTVMLSTGDDPWHLDLLPFRYGEAEGGFLMALLTPEAAPADENVAPRDIVLVLDRSGSMSGEKMTQAKAALSAVLEGLRPQDSFAVVTFDAFVETWSDQAVQASSTNLTEAQGFVNAITPDGGTNIYEALETGYASLAKNVGNPRYIVLLTDGQPTEGITDTQSIVEMVRLKNELGARIFSFGIGDDVNTVLLEKLANETGGDAIYITNSIAGSGSVTSAVADFFDQVVAPVMTDPVLDLSAFGADAIYPAAMPDLFAGQTVSILARYATPGSGVAKLTGGRQGSSVATSWDVTLPSYQVEEGWAPTVWATRHVGSLLHQAKLLGGDPVLEAEAVAVAARYGIVTEFTYYSADEDGDSIMTYSEVPLDEVGSKAVATSSSLDSYEDGDSVLKRVTQDVRYHRDRVLPLRSGWYTDSTLSTDVVSDWVDLHFGSERYFEVASAEAALGMGGFLSVGRTLRFELLGRAFRVSDPAAPPSAGLPAQTTSIPSATPVSAATVTEVVAHEATTGPPTQPRNPVVTTAESGSEAGCTVGAGPGSPAPGWLVLGVLAWLGLVSTTRRRSALG